MPGIQRYLSIMDKSEKQLTHDTTFWLSRARKAVWRLDDDDDDDYLLRVCLL